VEQIFQQVGQIYQFLQQNPVLGLFLFIAAIITAVEAYHRVVKWLSKLAKRLFSKNQQNQITTLQKYNYAPSLPVPTYQQNTNMSAPSSISRRRVLGLSLLGLGTVASLGGLSWLVAMYEPQLQNLVNRLRSATTPETPEGTTFVTYHGHKDAVVSLSWSPDGKQIASTDPQGLQVWSAINGQVEEYSTSKSNEKTTIIASWSPNGKYIATGIFGLFGEVQIWVANFPGSSESATAVTGSIILGPNSLVWSPNSKYIATASGAGTKIWDAATGKEKVPIKSQATFAVAWSPDGKYLASDGEILDSTNGKHISSYRGHYKRINSLGWSPDSKYVASACDDGTVRVWNMHDGQELFTYHGHSNNVNSVAWSPNSTRIASGSDDKTVQIWDAATGKPIYTYKKHSKRIRSVAWSPDGTRIASGSDDKTIQIWQAV